MKIYTNEMIKEKYNKKRKIKKALKFIYIPIIALFISICLFIAYQKIILKNNNINLFGYRAYIVLTGSMKPNINPNDIVIIKKAEKEKINVGDVITYGIENSSSTVTHRVTEVITQNDEVYYRTKGDNNNNEDTELVKYDNVQGKYVFKISKVGAMLTGGLTSTGIVIVFFILTIGYHHSSKLEDRMLTREEARKKYNTYKYGKDTDEEI